MRRVLLCTMALCLVASAIAMATVVSSKHDMRSTVPGKAISAANSTTQQVCVYCHHPHRGESSLVGSYLLWNIYDANKNYATYSSPTTNSSGIGGMLNSGSSASSASLLCMGCHDGSVGENSFVRDTAADGYLGDFPDLSGSTANFSSSIETDHPVDFTYPLNQYGIQPPTGDFVVGYYSSTMYPLFSGTMQCETCHDVHNGGVHNPLQFIRGDNTITSSVICRDCHILN